MLEPVRRERDGLSAANPNCVIGDVSLIPKRVHPTITHVEEI